MEMMVEHDVVVEKEKQLERHVLEVGLISALAQP